ncbi:Helicase C-terminal [Penicillium argentinense]|uniref:DNA helicase n=1 Tax=Penicillium argentinense TaxID=1131581 RepID=A0A9W9G494_9EURO|nr:Helicase C-terminal [Penicillium argentinense]KAJ5111350.1 Helicase C-terminal [Penicillium argentinense]
MHDSVPDTPVRDRKIALGTPEEDGDHDTIATVPVGAHTLTPSQRFTQPTQLVDMPYSKTPGSVVQVTASSPTAPAHSPIRRSTGGILSSLMAPSGTRFRSPANSLGPTKRTTVIDLEDGPTYRGGSSDDEDHPSSRSTDIKPAMFAKTSRSPEKEKVAESPVRPDGNTMDLFKEITSAAVYDPNATGTKRSADQMSPPHNVKGVATKKARQDMYTSVQDIQDYRLQIKVNRILNVLPQKSVQDCVDALLEVDGNFDVALDRLAHSHDVLVIEESEDELNAPVTRKAIPVPMAKQKIKARGTIQDKWASMNRPTTQREHSEEGAKPRGRLMRGPKNRASPGDASPWAAIEITSSPPAQKKAGRLQKGRRREPSRSESPEAAMSDSEDSDVQAQDSGPSDLDRKVLKFFNSCPTHDLADIAAIPEETANLITSNRPFRSLDEVRIVQAPVDESAKPKGKGKPRKQPKPIGEKIVDKCIEMWTGYLAIDALVAECASLGQPVANEMKKWGVDIFGKREGELELTSMTNATNGSSHDSGIATPSSNLQSPDSDDDAPVFIARKPKEAKFIAQPSIMADDLLMKDYQIVGINWLSLLFDKGLSCILADDMGLGKTCQVIAFLAHLYETGTKGPHLVVVPASTIENWLREFQKFCPTLNVIPYYAGQNMRAEIREQIQGSLGDDPDSVNVIITTYTIAKAKVDAKFLRELDFTVCVYDEGHMLKNHQSQLYEKLIRIPAQFRLLLTGTPLQNNLQELASLLGFILPGVFKEHKDDLNAVFSNKAKTTDESHATLLSAQRIERAKSMLKPFVLRRKKHQVIELPAKHAHVEYCKMKPSQRAIYDHEQEGVRQLLTDRANGVKTGSKSANILMKLRQAAIHPLLRRRVYDDATLRKMAQACLKEEKWSLSDPEIIFQELQPYNDFECHQMCIENPRSLGKFKLQNEEWMDSGKVDELQKLLTEFITKGDRTLIFSQFTMVMDILENVLETLKIQFVRLDGRTNVEDRQSILDAFHENTEIPVFLLSTKAGGAGINLACANKVVIFDSSFNPQEDVQAENRAHRVGQTREVDVYRFVTEGTIEEQIYSLGQTKLLLDQAVAGDEDGGKAEQQGMNMVEKMVLAGINKDSDEKE